MCACVKARMTTLLSCNVLLICKPITKFHFGEFNFGAPSYESMVRKSQWRDLSFSYGDQSDIVWIGSWAKVQDKTGTLDRFFKSVAKTFNINWLLTQIEYTGGIKLKGVWVFRRWMHQVTSHGDKKINLSFQLSMFMKSVNINIRTGN